jgi:hypothetical protein
LVVLRKTIADRKSARVRSLNVVAPASNPRPVAQAAAEAQQVPPVSAETQPIAARPIVPSTSNLAALHNVLIDAGFENKLQALIDNDITDVEALLDVDCPAILVSLKLNSLQIARVQRIARKHLGL